MKQIKHPCFVSVLDRIRTGVDSHRTPMAGSRATFDTAQSRELPGTRSAPTRNLDCLSNLGHQALRATCHSGKLGTYLPLRNFKTSPSSTSMTGARSSWFRPATRRPQLITPSCSRSSTRSGSGQRGDAERANRAARNLIPIGANSNPPLKCSASGSSANRTSAPSRLQRRYSSASWENGMTSS